MKILSREPNPVPFFKHECTCKLNNKMMDIFYAFRKMYFSFIIEICSNITDG